MITMYISISITYKKLKLCLHLKLKLFHWKVKLLFVSSFGSQITAIIFAIFRAQIACFSLFGSDMRSRKYWVGVLCMTQKGDGQLELSGTMNGLGSEQKIQIGQNWNFFYKYAQQSWIKRSFGNWDPLLSTLGAKVITFESNLILTVRGKPP